MVKAFIYINVSYPNKRLERMLIKFVRLILINASLGSFFQMVRLNLLGYS